MMLILSTDFIFLHSVQSKTPGISEQARISTNIHPGIVIIEVRANMLFHMMNVAENDYW